MNKKSKHKKHEPVVVSTMATDEKPVLKYRSESDSAAVKATPRECSRFEFLFRALLCALPFVIFFSYYPIISFGSSQSMNFELSLPLIWLVLFDLLIATKLVRQKLLFHNLNGKWWILALFPVWLTISIIWSPNQIRGLLTTGILWLIVFAGYGVWSFRKLIGAKFRRSWLKWFFGASLVVCAWCVLQCVLDLSGISREYTLMCAGCTYKMFGFPHPNGFAIEPQFMGNLLLAPTLLSVAIMCQRRVHVAPIKIITLLFIFASVLFLTFSRGAIYAFSVGLIFLITLTVIASSKNGRGQAVKRAAAAVGIVCLAFLTTLTAQGIMAEIGPTNDTFKSGIAKALNHLTLGVVDVRAGNKGSSTSEENHTPTTEATGNDDQSSEKPPVENPVENSEEIAAFDGYVEESTDARVRLNDAALTVWQSSVNTMLFGVGIGGAGQALYTHGLSASPKEIVQNQYFSLLLESGLVGIALVGVALLYITWALWRNKSWAVLSLAAAYCVSLMFFSGPANAVHIYLLPILLYSIGF